ncbi:MAG: hypothetical protein NTX52_04365 [Planctomycetota bacterium]|jgi:hypothetical protein|nr:hypothetical protein [Planctomycetota bacterium]
MKTLFCLLFLVLVPGLVVAQPQKPGQLTANQKQAVFQSLQNAQQRLNLMQEQCQVYGLKQKKELDAKLQALQARGSAYGDKPQIISMISAVQKAVQQVSQLLQRCCPLAQQLAVIVSGTSAKVHSGSPQALRQSLQNAQQIVNQMRGYCAECAQSVSAANAAISQAAKPNSSQNDFYIANMAASLISNVMFISQPFTESAQQISSALEDARQALQGKP